MWHPNTPSRGVALVDEKQTNVSKRGGARPGGGRPKGGKNAKTLEIEAAARLYAGDALAALRHVAHNGESEGARVSAAVALLDRGYGRARQSVELSGAVELPTIVIQ